MKQIINRIFNNIERIETRPNEEITDKVLTASQLEGLRQAYMYQQEIEEEEKEEEKNEDLTLWAVGVKKGGD